MQRWHCLLTKRSYDLGGSQKAPLGLIGTFAPVRSDKLLKSQQMQPPSERTTSNMLRTNIIARRRQSRRACSSARNA
jgi:hypothetical protein